MKTNLILFSIILMLASSITASAYAQTYPKLAEGSGFGIQGNVGFQSSKYQTGSWNSLGYIFYVEKLTGTLNGTNARLGLTTRGGTLSFHNEQLCQVQLYADSKISLHVSGADVSATVVGQSWNSTFYANTDILLQWGYAITLPHEAYWSSIIGGLGTGLLFAGVIMFAYAVKEHKWWILDADKTMLGIIAVCLFIFGIGLIFYWLLS